MGKMKVYRFVSQFRTMRGYVVGKKNKQGQTVFLSMLRPTRREAVFDLKEMKRKRKIGY